MKIYSNNIHNGYIDDAMGKRGQQFIQGKKPSRSFHLAWEDLPPSTISLALIFTDEDAIPVCGFTWIHWTVANIDPVLDELPENASEHLNLLEGVTSWSSGIIPEDWRINKADDAGFGGCAPPDKEHLYTIELYALDKKLMLSQGFFMNDLLKAMKGHVLDKCILEALYKTK